MINFEDFLKVEIKIGEIKEVTILEKSDKLIVEKVDFGEEEYRTVVSGIKNYFEDVQDLVGLKCAFVTNLEPRKIMGIESQAMIMAASTDEEDFSPLIVSQDIPVGTKIG
jgi:methionyl-tRNA synthetase